jgi:hypothetical protein
MLIGSNGLYAEGEFKIRFAGEGILTADVVAESLWGWHGLYVRIPGILGERFPPFKYLRLVPILDTIDHGSMVARIVARLVAKSDADARAMEESLDAQVDLITSELLENVSRMNTAGKYALAAVLGGVVMHGFMNVSGYLKEPERATINNASGNVMNNSAIYLNVDPGTFTGMIDTATKDNAQLTRQTLSALRPSAALSDGSIQIGDDGTNLVITADAAKIIARTKPSDLMPRIESRRCTNTIVNVRAIDLDKKTSGWAAIVPEVSTNRIRLTVADSVRLTAAGSFRGDVDVDIAIDLDGNETPKKAHLLRLSGH